MKSFPLSATDPISFASHLPDAADVIVIGGGIIGVMTAWELSKKGHKVILLEKGRIAAEQSSRNWGWIRAQGRDPAELPIMVEAASMWRQMAREIGEDIGLRQSGVAYLANKSDDIGGYEAWLPHAKAAGVDSRILTSKETQDLLPDATAQWTGALWTPTDMRAEPWVAVPALARVAARDGVTIIEGCAVRLLDIAAGRIAGVVTELGRIKTASVVLAGGAWSSLLLRRHGVNIPQLSVRAAAAATGPLTQVNAGGAVDNRIAFRRRQDGGYTLAPSGFHELFIGPDAFRAFARFARLLLAAPLGTRFLPKAPKDFPDGWATKRHWSGEDISPFECMRVLTPSPNTRKVTGLAKTIAEIFPQMGEVKIKTAWAGMIDTMPDVVPVVDHAAKLPGLTIATGMCGHGFGIGPAFGRIAAQLVVGEDSCHNLDRFRLSRFTDGSTLTPGPNL